MANIVGPKHVVYVMNKWMS